MAENLNNKFLDEAGLRVVWDAIKSKFVDNDEIAVLLANYETIEDLQRDYYTKGSVNSILDNYATKLELQSEAAKKVDKQISGTNGEAYIFNERDGGGARFVHKDGSESFVGVNDGGEDGLMAQIYADKLNAQGKWEGAKLDVTNNGIYYTVGDKSFAERAVEDNELATKKDIQAIIIPEYSLSKESDAGDYAAIYHLTKDGVSVGQAINIPKDQLLKSVEVKVCEEKDVPIEGLIVGDKYLDFTFIVEKGAEAHTYIAIKDMVKPYTAGNGIVITSENAITYDPDEIAPVNYVDQSITNLKTYFTQELNNEHAGRVAGDNLKVDKKVTGSNGNAFIFNEGDGGGAKFEGSNNVISYVGTHDNIGGEIGAQIYVDKASGTESTIIDVTQNGAYYTKGEIKPGSQRDVAANEIATIGDIEAHDPAALTEDEILDICK